MAGVLLKVICQHQGALDYDNLVDIGSGLDLNDTLDTLLENNELFSIHMVNGVKRVVAKTSVRRCKAQECQGCEDLHVCKFYLLGKCTNGRGRRVCRLGHNLHSEHNSGVLREHQLNTLSREDLCQLLLQNDNSFLPPVCNTYNRGPGPYGHCPDQESCRRLHVCERYIRDTCAAGAGCSRSHDFWEPHPLRTLQQRGVPDSLVPSLLTTYQNIQALRNEQDSAYKSSGKPPSSQRKETVKDEICMFFVKGDCKQGDRCWRAHCKLPYRWEVKVGESWTVLPDNEAIERDFCDPSNTHSSHGEAAGCVRFDSMTLGLNEVRRLSTLSSVVQPAYILTTQWVWYWLDEYGRWVQYASVKEMHRMSTITSEALESRYQEDTRAVVEFSAGQQSYELSFPDMAQRNVRWSTARRVRRRPVFVSSSDAQAARSRSNGPRNVRTFKAVPGFWDKSAIPDIGYKAVPLPSSERDYQKVQELFAKTMSSFRISSIERVQNRDLWEVFQWKRELMKKNNGGKYSRELLLFHGTDPKHVDAICRDNFDWRLCGTNGTVYGEGSYFARDAKYSHSYTGRLGGRSMFACRVLVGDYTRGSSALRRPPPKAEGDLALYDSCVDDAGDPSIYVVFEKHQVYPEFLITYEDGAVGTPLRPVATPSRSAPSLPVLPASSNPSAGLIPAPAGTKQRTASSPLSSGHKAPAPTPPLGLAYVSPSKPATVRTQLKRPTLSSSRDSLTSAATTPSTTTAKTPSHALSTPASTSSHALSTPASTSSHDLILFDDNFDPLTPSTPASTSSHAPSTPASTYSFRLLTPASTSSLNAHTSSSSLAIQASTSSLTTQTSTSSITAHASTSSHTLISPASTSSLRLITPASTSSPTLISPASTSSPTLITPASTSSHTSHPTVSHPLAHSSTPATPKHRVSRNPFSTSSPTHPPASSLFPVFSPSTGAQFRPLSSPASSIHLKYEGPTSQPPTRKTKEKDKCILQ